MVDAAIPWSMVGVVMQGLGRTWLPLKGAHVPLMGPSHLCCHPIRIAKRESSWTWLRKLLWW